MSLLLCGPVANAVDFTGKYTGTLEDEPVVLELTQKGTELEGLAKSGATEINLRGKVAGEQGEGALSMQGLPLGLNFRMTLAGSKLTMKLAQVEDGKANWADADTVVFERQGGEGPKSDKERLANVFRRQPTATLKQGKEYVHATGAKFRYPASWKVTETDEGLKLVPPDPGRDETILILGESAEGATDPASKEIVAYLDSQVRSALPFVRQVGQVERATSGVGKGAFLTWEGSHEGRTIQVRGYIAIVRNTGIALVAAGDKEKVAARDKVLREIFHTFGWGQGKQDPQLIGNWSHWSYKGSASYSRESKAQVSLRADGTFTYQSETETSASAQGKTATGDVAWTGGMGSRRGNGWTGTWAADGKNLILTFEDGTSESFTYVFKRESSGNVFLVVTEDGGKPTEWSRRS